MLVPSPIIQAGIGENRAPGPPLALTSFMIALNKVKPIFALISSNRNRVEIIGVALAGHADQLAVYGDRCPVIAWLPRRHDRRDDRLVLGLQT